MKTDTQLLAAYVERGERTAFDALVKALRHAEQVRDRSRFRAWLLRITVNDGFPSLPFRPDAEHAGILVSLLPVTGLRDVEGQVVGARGLPSVRDR